MCQNFPRGIFSKFSLTHLIPFYFLRTKYIYSISLCPLCSLYVCLFLLTGYIFLLTMIIISFSRPYNGIEKTIIQAVCGTFPCCMPRLPVVSCSSVVELQDRSAEGHGSILIGSQKKKLKIPSVLCL